jgi:hypothetical protein
MTLGVNKSSGELRVFARGLAETLSLTRPVRRGSTVEVTT